MNDDFWIQPSKGFTEKKRGRTEEEIQAKETSIGFRFPELYRTHMKLQNGGYLRKRALVGQNDVAELLYNGAVIDALDQAGYNTLEDLLLEYTSLDEARELLGAPDADFRRLPILSHMYGHSVLCFDYGYRHKEPLAEPEICLFELEGVLEERLRVKSYSELVEGLVYYGYESTTFFYGSKANESISAFAEKVSRQFGWTLEKDTSDRYGWFNFDEWYKASRIPVSKGLSLTITISPNKFRSGTYQFQDLTEYHHILEIGLIIGEDTYADNSDFQRGLLEKYLGADLTSVGAELILKPYNRDEQTGLEEMKMALEG